MTYSLTLITPQAIVFEGAVVCLNAPGAAGAFGVLAHHAPLIALLSAGPLTLTLEDDTKQSYQIGPGFLDVKDNKALLLTTSTQEDSPPAP